MKLPGGNSPAYPPEQAEQIAIAPPNLDDWRVVGNERLTALAGAVLLLLILVELVTAANLHSLVSIHLFVGLILVGPLLVKLGSTGYRLLRYYTGSPPFVRRGPPRLALRALGPVLVIVTIVLIVSGVGLVLTGPEQPGPLLVVHNLSAAVWLPMIAVHAFAHILRTPRLIADDWKRDGRPAERVPGSRWRTGVNFTALLLGVVAAVLLLPDAAPWVAWGEGIEGGAPGPLVAGAIISVLALLIARPLRWK